MCANRVLKKKFNIKAISKNVNIKIIKKLKNI